MKKIRRAHLWIGIIASVLIFVESITGLLMNEPWLIGQPQVQDMRANFQQGQFNRGQFRQGAGQANGMQGQNGAIGNEQGQGNGGQTQGQNGFNGNGQVQRQRGFGGSGNFPAGFRGAGEGQTSLLSTIRGLHEGRLGNTNIKWLIDLAALAMMFLTGTGIYLSIKVLGAERKRIKREEENFEDFVQ